MDESSHQQSRPLTFRQPESPDPPEPEPQSPHPRPVSCSGPPATRGLAHEAGQATAEYALVMLAAAALAGLLIAWAASTDGVGRLLDAVLDSIIEDAG